MFVWCESLSTISEWWWILNHMRDTQFINCENSSSGKVNSLTIKFNFVHGFYNLRNVFFIYLKVSRIPFIYFFFRDMRNMYELQYYCMLLLLLLLLFFVVIFFKYVRKEIQNKNKMSVTFFFLDGTFCSIRYLNRFKKNVKEWEMKYIDICWVNI